MTNALQHQSLITRYWPAGVFAVAVICFLGLVATIVYPPWTKVTGERLYWISVGEQKEEFAGFDFLTSAHKQVEKWHGKWLTYYRVSWGIVALEWAILLSISGTTIVLLTVFGLKPPANTS